MARVELSTTEIATCRAVAGDEPEQFAKVALVMRLLKGDTTLDVVVRHCRGDEPVEVYKLTGRGVPLTPYACPGCGAEVRDEKALRVSLREGKD